jgi:hypothetical protein
MAKKSRRARLSPTQRFIPTPGASAPVPAGGQAAAPFAVRTASRATQAVSRLGQNPEDYTHIRADLQRIGILAGSILAVLLALRILVFR